MVTGAYIKARLSQCRRLDAPVPLAEVDGLFNYLANYRLMLYFFLSCGSTSGRAPGTPGLENEK